MRNEKFSGLPDHLVPLLQPTPSGVAKLLAAWDGLNTESQMLILTQLDKAGLPGYLDEKVRIKALDSANAYVRYLAAKGLYFNDDDTEEKKAIKQRIEQDPSPLVRYCLLESEFSWAFLDPDLQDPDAFFALPHEARLAKVRLLMSHGEKIANLIEHAVNHQLKEGKVSEMELFEILSDYVNSAEFGDYYIPNYNRKQIDVLWRLVFKIPWDIAYIIVQKLPLTCEIFAEILAKPESDRRNILEELAYNSNLSLCIHEAVYDVLEGTGNIFIYGGTGRDAIKRKLEQLKGWQRREQLRELKLYRLAKQAVPWKQREEGYPPEGELEFLSKAVVEGDTWGTFMAFSKYWAKESPRTKKLEKHLPRIYEAGEDELGNDENMDDEDAE